MPKFTIESTYLLPVFRHRTYEAPTIGEACQLALADEDWEGQKEDYETCGPHYITGAWVGEDTAYEGEAIATPCQGVDPVPALRKAESFIAGFEDDELQEGIAELVSELRTAIATVEGRTND